MRTASRFVFLMGAMLAVPTVLAAGDPVVGQTKVLTCMACHGSKDFPGVFPLVQLAGRDADKLVIKTNKYRNGKLISPMMNLAVVGLTDQDVEDIAAYYHGLSKPALPLKDIRGDAA
jgi:cytochrome c553